MENDRRERRHHRNNESKHGGDKPGHASGIFRGRLCDPEGVDEGDGQEEQRAHSDWMMAEREKEREGAAFVHPRGWKRILYGRACRYGGGRECGVD